MFGRPDLMETAGWVLIHFLWQGALLGVVAWSGWWALKSTSARVRYLFLCGVLLVCGLAPVFTWVWLTHFDPVQRQTLIVSSIPWTQSGEPPDLPVSESLPYLQIHYSPFLGPPLNYVWISEMLHRWLPVGTTLWAVGVLFLSCRLAYDHHGLTKFLTSECSAIGGKYNARLAVLAKKMGIRRSILLVEAALVEVPAVAGWLKPVLLVPATFFTALPPEQIEAILAHELAHVRRYDYLVNLFQVMIETALFYHPAVWWISRTIREERENCCDDIAISVVGDELAYVSALAALEEARSLPVGPVLAGNGGSLLKRVRRVIDPRGQDQTLFMDLLRESYKGMVLGMSMVCLFCTVSFATYHGSVTKHVDSSYLNNALSAATAKGNASEIEDLLKQGADPNANVIRSGNNALFLATTDEKMAVVRLLLKNGANPNSRNTSGNRAVDWALAKGDLAMATVQREAGADISPAAWAGATGDLITLKTWAELGLIEKDETDEAMRNAVAMGHLDVVQFFERIEGKPIAGKYLSDAASSGNISMLAYILKQGADMRTDGGHALDEAVLFYDQPEAAAFLLAHGANPNRFTPWGRYILAEARSAKMIKILLAAGANPNLEDAVGPPLVGAPDAESVRLLIGYGAKPRSGSMIESAIYQDNRDRPDVISELIKQGADFSPQFNGVDALATAAAFDKVETMKLLLAAGVSSDAHLPERFERVSVLHYAAKKSSVEAVRLLLEEGGTTFNDPQDATSALSLALQSGNWDMTNLLRAAGARDVGDLSIAAAFGDLDEVSRLIESGANVNETDHDGNTPLFYALRRGRKATARLLMQYGASIHRSTVE